MKWTMRRVLDNDKLVWLISLLIAIVAWFVVALEIDPNTTQLIKGVKVDINAQTGTLNRLELHAIDGGEATVDVYIKGPGVVVGRIKPEDLKAVAGLSGVTGPGVIDLPLEVVNASGEEFEITSFKPSTITVKFDRLQTRTLPIEVDINGLSVPEGYMVEKESVTPGEVTLTGPEIDISKVEKCIVAVNITEPLEKTKVEQADIILLDRDGNSIESTYITMDITSAEVAIPVKKILELPLKISFINQPPGFPLDQLSYTLSNNTIVVAAAPDVIDRYSEIHLGYIDINELDFIRDYAFEVALPSGFININNVETVLVEFNHKDFTTSSFNLTNFVIKNRPSNFDVSVTTKRLSNVRIVGAPDVLAGLTANDIIAEIDLSDRSVHAGQFSLPLKIYVPTKGLVWAVGDYSAVVTIKER